MDDIANYRFSAHALQCRNVNKNIVIALFGFYEAKSLAIKPADQPAFLDLHTFIPLYFED